MSAKTNTQVADAPDYKNLIDLMAIFSEATARKDELENDLHQAWLDLVDARRKDYSKLQASLANAEEGIRFLAETNPQWFAKARSLKTPYGTVSFRKGSKLQVTNEEVSIVLLEQLGQEGLPFLKTEKHLVLEALEKLDEKELERLRIKRVETETFAIKTAKPDMGKAVANAAKAEATAEVTK
jgi:hypothetical protein